MIYPMNSSDIFMTLLITVNPVAVLATYLSITASYTSREREKVLRQAIIFALSVLLLTLILGNVILDGLGLERFALQIAGGLLFFKFGWEAMHSRPKVVIEDDEPSGLVPLGFPVIAGPGSITAVIILSSTPISNKEEWALTTTIGMAVIISIGITYLILRYADYITAKLGKTATRAIVRITGLLIVTLGIQLMLSGLAVWISGL